MTRAPSAIALSRAIAAVAVVASVLAWVPGSVAAHGEYAGSTVGVAPTVAVAGVTTVGVVTGVGATRRRVGELRGRSVHLDRAVGPLLTVLGLVAVAVGVERGVLLAFGGAVAGVAVAGTLRHWGSRGTCAEATVGVIAIHRVAEGVAIAALVATSTTVGVVTAAVVAVHTGVECLTIGGHPDLDARRATRAVLAVQAAFVVGVALGVLAVGTVATGTASLSAGIGGVLVVFGAGLTMEG